MPAPLLQSYSGLHVDPEPLFEELQKELLLDPASGDPATDSGLKELSLLKQYSLFARSTTIAASSE